MASSIADFPPNNGGHKKSEWHSSNAGEGKKYGNQELQIQRTYPSQTKRELRYSQTKPRYFIASRTLLFEN